MAHGNRRARSSRVFCESATESSSRGHRSVVILPGLGNASNDYDDLVEDLEASGLTTKVVPVQRYDWLRNAAGLRDVKYWQGMLTPRPTVDWFLNRLDETVDSVKQETDGLPITILAHSAGGWLGRIYMKDFGTTGIDRFVSLGSPHLPPPEGAEGVVDQTRGILTFCNDNCPGAYHNEVEYITIAGKFIKGARIRGEGTVQQKLVGLGYQQVCGDCEVWGDGVVPLPAAHLEGGKNVDLEGVYHSPVGAVRSANGEEGDSKKERLWYGSEGVLDKWIEHING